MWRASRSVSPASSAAETVVEVRFLAEASSGLCNRRLPYYLAGYSSFHH